MQASVTEQRYDIRISGEARDIGVSRYQYFGDRRPAFQVALSKVFLLDKLVDFLVKG